MDTGSGSLPGDMYEWIYDSPTSHARVVLLDVIEQINRLGVDPVCRLSRRRRAFEFRMDMECYNFPCWYISRLTNDSVNISRLAMLHVWWMC
jgi:hypothetical protein